MLVKSHAVILIVICSGCASGECLLVQVSPSAVPTLTYKITRHTIMMPRIIHHLWIVNRCLPLRYNVTTQVAVGSTVGSAVLQMTLLYGLISLDVPLWILLGLHLVLVLVGLPV
jgi:hypothetical protein